MIKMERPWAERQYVINDVQRDALLQWLENTQTVTSRVTDWHSLFFDTVDAATARRCLTNHGFAELMALEATTASLAGNSQVTMALYRRVADRWTRRSLSLTLRDAELFLRAGLPPHGLDVREAQVLCDLMAYRARARVHPSMVVASRQHVLRLSSTDSLTLLLEEDLRSRRMALSLEAGSFGEPVLPPGKVLLRIRTSLAIPPSLAAQLQSLAICRASSPGHDLLHQRSRKEPFA